MLTALGGTKKSKFIDIRNGYIKEQIENHNVQVVQVQLDQQDADIFTQPLGRITFAEN